MNKPTFYDLFSGIGAFRLGLEKNEFKCVGSCEIDDYARQVYSYRFQDNNIDKDVTKINPKDVPDIDILTFGFPCFVKNTLVYIKNDIIPIEQVVVGDKVLTHDGTYQTVNNISKRNYNKLIYEIKGYYGVEPILCTDEHPFYVVSKTEDGKFTQPFWLEANKLDKNKHFLVLVKDKDFNNEYKFEAAVKFSNSGGKKNVILNTESKDFWFFVGFYIAEGYRLKERKRKYKDGIKLCPTWRTVICCNDKEIDFIFNLCKKLFNRGTLVKERTCNKIHIVHQALYEFLEQFGRRALNKHIPYNLFSIKKDYLQSLIDGYFFGDGCIDKSGKFSSATTVSKQLVYDLQKLLTKIDERIPSITRCNRPKQHVIEGRTVNQHDTYTLRRFFNHKRIIHQHITDNYIYLKIKEITTHKFNDNVYNLTVENNESYCVSNYIATHNCQSFSFAGYRKGFNDSRGNMFFEACKIIEEKKPKIIFAENVRGLLNINKGFEFGTILNTLHQLGYDAEWQCINAKYFLPQQRDRVFLIGYLREKCRTEILPILNSNEMVEYQPEKQQEKQCVNCIDANYWKGIDKHGQRTAVMVLTGHTTANIKQRVQYRNSTWTLDTTGNKQAIVDENTKLRRLTPLECERLMGFPDNWTNVNNLSDTRRYKMLGNSIVVPIIDYLAKKIKVMF